MTALQLQRDRQGTNSRQVYPVQIIVQCVHCVASISGVNFPREIDNDIIDPRVMQASHELVLLAQPSLIPVTFY